MYKTKTICYNEHNINKPKPKQKNKPGGKEKMLKAGLIAQGSITNAHYPAYIEMEEKGIAIVEAVADVRPEMFDKHKRLKNTANIKEYSDYNELIEAEAGKLDFVDICLPTFLHCDAACKAMEAGINVIVEKPMALSYEQCVKMCETAKKTGKTSTDDYCFEFHCSVFCVFVNPHTPS